MALTRVLVSPESWVNVIWPICVGVSWQICDVLRAAHWPDVNAVISVCGRLASCAGWRLLIYAVLNEANWVVESVASWLSSRAAVASTER